MHALANAQRVIVYFDQHLARGPQSCEALTMSKPQWRLYRPA